MSSLVDGDGAGTLIDVQNLVKHFSLPKKSPWSRRSPVVRAVDDVSFKLGEQRTISLVGESGCGKTTIARMVLGLEKPSSGKVLFRGRDISELKGTDHRDYRTSVQAVFQDPSTALNPRRRVRAIVGEPLAVNLGLKGSKLNARIDDLLAAVGLDPVLGKSFPHELSGGMRQRVAVAQSLALKPSLILLDEPVSALDVSIRAQIMNLLKDLQAELGVSYLLIAHDLATVRYLSHQVAAVYLGQIVEFADSESMFTQAMHPYSIALISAADKSEDPESRPRIVLRGEVASPTDPPDGCRFHPRCWLRTQLDNPKRCSTETPSLRHLGDGHQVACHFAEELQDAGHRASLLDAAREASRVVEPDRDAPEPLPEDADLTPAVTHVGPRA